MNEALGAGLELMLIGMGIVFTFLMILILTANVMSKFVQRLYPEPETTPSQPAQKSGDGAVIAAITAAVHQHRSNN